MLSVKSDRPVDPITVAVIREIDSLAVELNLPYFVVGAMARDIVITHVFGLETGQATHDVDFAMAVESWDQYESITQQLLTRKQFQKGDVVHKLYYVHASGIRYPLDVIPFRGVEHAQHTIAWPPEMKILMNVVGYEEALATAVIVQIEPGLSVRVASLPGLALLKFIAWIDRGHGNSRDALDLLTLFRRYPDAGNQDRLYGADAATLEAVDFDLDLAGPRLLGQDVRRIAEPSALSLIRNTLDDTKAHDRLATHMAQGLTSVDDSFAAAEQLLDQFKVGLAGD